MNNPRLKETLSLIKTCYNALDDKKAIDIKILKLAEKSSVTDFFVIATGTSEPHISALRKEIERRLHEQNFDDIKIDYTPESGWAVIDGFDFMIHLFLNDTRENFGLENLWKDAEVLDISDF